MSAYRGNSDCTSDDCTRIQHTATDGSMTSECFGWHCSYCHGHASPVGVCRDRCRGYQDAEQRFNAMHEEIRVAVAENRPPSLSNDVEVIGGRYCILADTEPTSIDTAATIVESQP